MRERETDRQTDRGRGRELTRYEVIGGTEYVGPFI